MAGRLLAAFLMALILVLAAAHGAAALSHLRRGDTGERVVKLQKDLTALGFRPGRADGLFGSQTEQAVMAFQREANLGADGIAGPRTLQALAEAIAALRKGTETRHGHQIHVVARGETLRLIADLHGVPVSALAAANGIPNPDQIYAGQRIVIPAARTTGSVPDPQPPSRPRDPPARGLPPQEPLPQDPPPQDPRQETTAPVPGKRIALTFNDGPDPQHTPEILSVLGRTAAKATFFVVGADASREPDLVRRMVAEGHDVGNHSYSHRDMAYLTEQQVAWEIERTARLVAEITGKRTRYFRPPFGSLTAGVLRGTARQGHTLVLWSNATLTGMTAPDSASLLEGLTSIAYNKAIFMLHGTSAHTVAVLPALIERLQGMGYELVTLSELAQ